MKNIPKPPTDPKEIADQEWIKSILESAVPRHLELTEDFVLIFPGSFKGGPGKSTTLITVASGLRLLGLKFLVGTYDTTNETLSKAFGEDNVVTLEARDEKQTRADLAKFKNTCRENKAIGLIDLPGAVNNQTSTLIDNLSKARIVESAHLILICPVRPDKDEIEGAFAAIEIFDPNSVLLRAWRPSMSWPPWESFAAWKHLENFPVWHCDNWTASIKEVLTRSGGYTDLPTVPDIPKYLADNYKNLKDIPRLDIEDAVEHLEDISKYLYHTVLKDITRPVPDPGHGQAGATDASAGDAETTTKNKRVKP
jgi:hypothetical protein